MKILNKQSLFTQTYTYTYNSINDIKFRKNIDGVMIPSHKGNANLIVAAPALQSPRPPHFPKKLIVSFFILLLLITSTKKNK